MHCRPIKALRFYDIFLKIPKSSRIENTSEGSTVMRKLSYGMTNCTYEISYSAGINEMFYPIIQNKFYPSAFLPFASVLNRTPLNIPRDVCDQRCSTPYATEFLKA